MFPVVQPHYWALELLGFKLGNHSMIDVGALPVKRLIVDSGTTFFTAPEELHDLIVAKIPEASCDEVNSYPPMTYVLKASDGQTYELVVSQETYMIGGHHDSNQVDSIAVCNRNPVFPTPGTVLPCFARAASGTQSSREAECNGYDLLG